MDHVIASAGLRLTYLCDPSSIRALDPQRIMDDLSEPDTRYALCGWFARVCLADFDHVALATDIDTGRHVAMLAANDGDTPNGSYLDLRAAFVIDAMRGSVLMRRLLAYTILRIDSLGVMPRVIAARTSIAACYSLLSLFAQNIPGATMFPEPDAPAIDLARAGLAREIARNAAPRLDYEAGSGTIRGAKLIDATCFAKTTGTDRPVSDMFQRSLGGSDHMMVIVDMRSCDERIIAAETRTLVRSRWKIPFLSMQSVTPSAATIGRRKPTLIA